VVGPRGTVPLSPEFKRCVSWRSKEASIRFFDMSLNVFDSLSGVSSSSADTVLSGAHIGEITSVFVSSDSSVLVSGGEDARIALFQLGRDQTYSLIGYLHGHTSAIRSLKVSQTCWWRSLTR
jgi:WD40 repeat protein